MSHRCLRYGFTEVPGGAAWASKSVLSWHNSVLGKITPDDECAMRCSLLARARHHAPHESDTTPGSTARCCGCSAEAGSLRPATRSCRCSTSGRCCRQRAAWRLRVARSRVCWSCSSFVTISYRSYGRNFHPPPLMTLHLPLYQLSWMHWGYKWYPPPPFQPKSLTLTPQVC